MFVHARLRLLLVSTQPQKRDVAVLVELWKEFWG